MMMSRVERLGFQFNARRARAQSAITLAVSPARRGPSVCGIFRPVIFSVASITCRTLKPVPLPRLQISEGPPDSSLRSAVTWASATSLTWT